MVSSLLRGALAGAAGTTALNAITYLDMALRGRPASNTPQETVDRLAHKAGTTVPGDQERRGNRLTGLGAVLGTLTGIAVGAGYGVLRSVGWRPSVTAGGLVTGAAAMAASAVPMTVLGVTDPRDWRPADWAGDVVPHLAYGLVTAGTYALTGCRKR